MGWGQGYSVLATIQGMALSYIIHVLVILHVQPNSMGIDLRDVDKEFYLKVKELNMVSQKNNNMSMYGSLILIIRLVVYIPLNIGYVNSCWGGTFGDNCLHQQHTRKPSLSEKVGTAVLQCKSLLISQSHNFITTITSALLAQGII